MSTHTHATRLGLALSVEMRPHLRWRFAHGVDRETLARSTLSRGVTEGGDVVAVLARRTRHGDMEYECMIAGKPEDETEWRGRTRLQAEGFGVLCRRFDEVMAGVDAGMDLRKLTTADVQTHLSDFGLDRSVGTHGRIRGLSGGQKSKLLFAAAMWTRPHVLILDEPTNYLDRDTLRALRNALHHFKGAFLIVSHNHDFLEGLCTEEWLVQDGQVVSREPTAERVDGSQAAVSTVPSEEEPSPNQHSALSPGGRGAPASLGGSGSASGSHWAAGTTVNSNSVKNTDGILRDAKGRPLSKKEIRAMERKGKQPKQLSGTAQTEAAGVDDDKKAKRLAKKLAKQGLRPLGPDAATVSEQKRGAEATASGTLADDTDLERAKLRAAELRAQSGGFTGTIEVEKATVPNPGGGENLVEDARFVLVPGRIYGLIGRNGTGTGKAAAGRMAGLGWRVKG